MEELLHEITALPKVIGCFLFSSSKGVTRSNMPPIFTEDAVNTIGTLLARSKQMGKDADLNIEGIDLRYNETELLAKPLDTNAVLITICEPGANKQLLDMSINMVINDIATLLESDPVASDVSKKPKLQMDPALKPILAKIKSELAEDIGPIAGPVLDDCLKKWSNEGQQSIKRLPDLAWMICREIDDDRLERKFMEKIKKYF